MTDENGESTERKRTTISMPQSKLEEFKAHAEEQAEYNSLSHFLRVAGTHEIGGSFGHGTAEVEAPDELEEDLTELKKQMREMQEGMNDLRDLFETLEIRTREPSEDVKDLQNELFEELPDEQATEVAETAVGAGNPVTSAFQNEYRYLDNRPVPGWPEDLTDAVDAARKVDVVDALDRMAEELGVVERTEIDGEPWFYKVV